MIVTDFGDVIAERMRAEHRVLAARWFERLLDVLPVSARDVFPTESLLDHIPSLIDEIGNYLRQPTVDAIEANTAILEKARELGALRHSQKASLHQLLREYQILSGVLINFVQEELQHLRVLPAPADAMMVVTRLHQAVGVLSQSTVEAFVTLYTRTISEQSERLEEFTRMAAHEWRQPLGALQFGVSLLSEADLDPARRQRTVASLARNVQHLVALTHQLEAVARVNNPTDNAVIQEVSSATVAREAARQLREMADARGVEIRIADDLPDLTVEVGRLELTFVNLLSNAVKYADSTKPHRYVDVVCEPGDEWCRIVVRDNGVGIPQAALGTIFDRFTRAHGQREDLREVGGMGLGLAIVEDCMRAMHGRIEVESIEGVGTAFVLVLPRRHPVSTAEPPSA